MSEADASRAGHAAETVAVESERRWAIVVGIVIALLVLMMVFTGLHWAAMPPSRVVSPTCASLFSTCAAFSGDGGLPVLNASRAFAASSRARGLSSSACRARASAN